MQVVAEFTVEPFVEGRPGPHVTAAIASLTDAGLDPEMGPFGSTVRGEGDIVFPALLAAVGAATLAGATTVSVQIRVV